MKRLVFALTVMAALSFPFWANDFWVGTVVSRMLVLAVLALSLTFLASFAGLVSFAQMGVASFAGYALALLSTNTSGVGSGISWPLAVIAAVALATLAGFVLGVISIKSSGIYLLMITLAISVCMFYFVSQNTAVFNGFDGINGISAPTIGSVNLRAPMPFYFLCLGVAAALALMVAYLGDTPVGSLLHAYRNAPLRLSALGFNVVAIRLVAFIIAGFIAGVGGVLNTWYNGQISPSAFDVHSAVLLLVVAVIGGMKRPTGAFLGAAVYVLLENFATTFIGPERFNLIIGIAFMVIVSISRDGLLGLLQNVARLLKKPAFGAYRATLNKFSQ